MEQPLSSTGGLQPRDLPFPGFELPWSHYFHEYLLTSGSQLDWTHLTLNTPTAVSKQFNRQKYQPDSSIVLTSNLLNQELNKLSGHARCGRLCGLAGSRCPKPRPYKCRVCHRQFARSDMLARHSRLHNGHRPYICADCGLTFSRSDHLNTHTRVSHRDTPSASKYSANTGIQAKRESYQFYSKHSSKTKSDSQCGGRNYRKS